MIAGKNDIVCFYDMENNTINIIDSLSISNIFIKDKVVKKHNKLYIGVDKDSLFYYDKTTQLYYKSMYPFNESNIYNGDYKKIFDKIRQLEIIENKNEFIIPNNFNLVYCDSDYLFHYSLVLNQTYKLRPTAARFEGYMFQYSNDKLILVSGIFDGLNDFYEAPYIYDINTHSITSILFYHTKFISKFFYYDKITKEVIVQINKKLYKATIKKDRGYFLKIDEILLDLNNIKHKALYDLFKINDKYIIKKQSDFKCNYFIFRQ